MIRLGRVSMAVVYSRNTLSPSHPSLSSLPLIPPSLSLCPPPSVSLPLFLLPSSLSFPLSLCLTLPLPSSLYPPPLLRPPPSPLPPSPPPSSPPLPTYTSLVAYYYLGYSSLTLTHHFRLAGWSAVLLFLLQ